MGLFNFAPANRAVDQAGNPIENAIRRIYPMGSVAIAPVFVDPDLTAMRSSEVRSNANGYFDLCYVKNGTYRVEVRHPLDEDGPPIYQAESVEVGSTNDHIAYGTFQSFEDLQNDTLLSYAVQNGHLTIRPGALLRLDGPEILLRVLPAEAATAHLTTAGGVKFNEVGVHYTTVERFIDAVSAGEVFEPGITVTAGGTAYVFADDGATELTGLPGWVPAVSSHIGADLEALSAKTDLISVTQPVDLDVLAANALAVELSGGNLFDTVAAGVAGTPSGEAFLVPMGPGTQLYRNDGGIAVFVAWVGDILFETVAEMRATDIGFPPGVILRAKQGAFSYRVADPSDPDAHLTAGSNALYVLPANGAFPFEAWGVSGTGENGAPALATAARAAVSEGVALDLGGGTTLVGTGFGELRLDRGQQLRIFSSCGAKLEVEGGLSFGAESVLTTLLAADAARHDRYLSVADTTGVEVGDLLHIIANTPLETGWNYPKSCVRRVAHIDGTTLLLDQPLEFFFTVAEATEVRCYVRASVHLDGVAVELGENDRPFHFSRLSDCSITNSHVVGQVRGWEAGWSDGPRLNSCDRFLIDGVNFERLRYAPNITSGSRNVSVKNGTVKRVRHVDANSWAQDILLENLTGIDTDGIIQCHPCIRPVFRNCTDSVTNPNLYGVDLRGLGEIVEDCTALHTQPTPGVNTNAPLLLPEYEDMALDYTRRITRLRAPYTRITPGKEGRFIVEDSEVADLIRTGFSAQSVEIEVDDLTRVFEREGDAFDFTRLSSFNYTAMRGRRADLPLRTQYRTRTATSRIEAIAAASPVLVTTQYDHRLETGDQVSFDAVGGMTELDGNTYTVTVTGPREISLDGIDGTSFTPFTEGGTLALITPRNSVTGVSTGTTTVITSAGHGYQEGDLVWIAGLQGPVQLNRTYYKVTAPDASSFALLDPATDAPIDSSGAPAYTSGGIVTRQESVQALEAGAFPQCGIRDCLRLRTEIEMSEQFDQQTFRMPLKYRAFNGGLVDQGTRWGVLRAKAYSTGGWSASEYTFTYDAQNGDLFVSEVNATVPNVEVSIVVSNFERHYADEIVAEGEAEWLLQNGARHYMTFDVEVDLKREQRRIQKIVLEFDEQSEN